MKNYPKRILPSLILLIAFLPFSSIAQLSGTYTIGGINPDYTTIASAVTALNAGVSGPVVFNIRSGIYDEAVVCYGATGASTINTITFQSELLDSTTVTVTNTKQAGYSTFDVGDFIVLKELTIKNPSTKAIFCFNGLYLQIENCYILDTLPSTLAIELLGQGRWIRNCRIEGNIMINFYNSDSIILVENNIIYGNLSSGYCKINCIGNSITGNVEISYGEGADFENNTLTTGYLQFSYNTSIIKNNKIINGWFMDITFDTSAQIINNEIQVDRNGFRVIDAPNSQVIGNKFFSESEFVNCDSSVITNNFFYNNGIIISDYCSIKFNNWAPNQNLYMVNFGYSNIIENNIFPSEYQGYIYTGIIDNNDYIFSGGLFDSHPFHINPQYKSTTDIHSTNPQLKGIGIWDPKIKYDIDSVLRPNPPSMGANEICLSSDTLNVFCGDSITLSLCSMPITGSFTWSPSNGLNDVHLVNPKLAATANNWYTVTDTSGYTDSVYINVIPLNTQAADTVKIPCSDSTILYAKYNAGATYHWYPASDVSDSTSYFTMVKPSQNEMFIVAETVPGCGTYYDTINVFLLPHPYVTYTDSCLTVTFYDSTICATSYWWDFGDSTHSTAMNPVHTYQYSGIYFVYMVAYNAYGNDTIKGNIIVDSCAVSFINEPSLEYISNVFPNPFSISTEISFSKELNDASLTIYNIFGQKVKSTEHISGNHILITRENLQSGIYIYDFAEKGIKICSGKLMVE